ncbi:MAG: hypothetical protein NC114_10815 [Ruminococcus flavefaciens]|nr:hypothetical protein [Ruminococcus flavefaciens]
MKHIEYGWEDNPPIHIILLMKRMEKMDNNRIITIDEQQTAIHDEIKQKIHEGYHLISFSLGMALGKTYNAFKIIEDFFVGKHVLYLAPNKQIIEEIKNKCCFKDINNICNVDFKCFASFNCIDDQYYNYDAIFIDEMHHISSPKQGQNIREIMRWYADNDKYVFGFTATPIYNRVNELIDTRNFFEWHVEGISTIDAIKSGILPTPIYSLVKKKNLVHIREKRERVTVESAYNVLRSKVDKHPEIDKYIAYFPQSLDLLDNYVMLRKLFPDFKLFVSVNYGCKITKIDRDENELNEYIDELLSIIEKNKNRENEIIQDMDNYNGKAIILNIGKLLEGSHPNTVNGIMFFRDTNNNVVFEQALGRALHKGSTIQPLFLDIAGSGDRVKKAVEEGVKPYHYNNHNRRKEKIRLVVDDENLEKFISVLDIEAEEIVNKSLPVVNITRKKYKDIVYYSQFDLMRKFNLSKREYEYKLHNEFNNNEHLLIDYYLKLRRRKIAGISFSSNEELARKLKKPLYYIEQSLNRGIPYVEIIKQNY